jgi:hypothetical protein
MVYIMGGSGNGWGFTSTRSRAANAANTTNSADMAQKPRHGVARCGRRRDRVVVFPPLG